MSRFSRLVLSPVLFMTFMIFSSISQAKQALVTGASRGIGYALTKQLLEGGQDVIAVARNVESLYQLKTNYPDHLQIVSADVSTDKGQMAVTSAVGSKIIDYLVHNAAVIEPLGEEALLEGSLEKMRNLLEINVLAPILLNRHLANNLKQGSRILMVSSRAGDRMVPGLGLYCVSKVALDRYTESLQMDKPRGVLAAAVHPGDVDTDMQGDLRKQKIEEFKRSELFRERKDRLTDPATSARFLKWLLVNSSDDEFVKKKHNIYASDTSVWNNGIPVEDPLK